jgi:hypothetical protein
MKIHLVVLTVLQADRWTDEHGVANTFLQLFIADAEESINNVALALFF